MNMYNHVPKYVNSFFFSPIYISLKQNHFIKMFSNVTFLKILNLILIKADSTCTLCHTLK